MQTIPTSGSRRLLVGRRRLITLAAVGLGGFVAACRGGGGSQPGVREATTPSPQAGSPPRTAEAGTPAPTAVAGEPQCLVTKVQGLNPGYVPNDLAPLPARVLAGNNVQLRRNAADAVVKLIDAAGTDAQSLFVLSGFRSFQEQEQILQEEERLYGKSVAAKQVAPAGHSEHQLGLAADITSKRAPYDLAAEFGQWPEGRWLADNAARFGFVISYPQGKEAVTGYTYEPWHIRFVGLQLAEQVMASGLTLTEFLPKYNMTASCP